MTIEEAKKQFPKSAFIELLEKSNDDITNQRMHYPAFALLSKVVSKIDEVPYFAYMRFIETLRADENVGVSYDEFIQWLAEWLVSREEDGASDLFQEEASSTEKEDNSVRKQEYVGNIQKCPNCGAPLQSMSAFCPSCGHELRKVEVSKSLKFFQEGLVKYEGNAERDFVASFPIPNEREELGNFMLMVASILKQDMQNGADQMRVSSFSSKFDEIKSKVYIMLKADDPIVGETKKWDKEINEMHENYKKIIEERAIINKKKQKEQERKDRKWERKRNSFWYNASIQTKIGFVMFFLIVLLYFGLFGSPVIAAKNETKRLENLYGEVTTLIENKNYEAAELALKNMVWSYESELLLFGDVDEYKSLWAGKKNELQNLIDERQGKKKSK